MILASGPTNPEADLLVKSILSDFVHEIIAVQRIDLAGRTIIAFHIGLDPAHFEAISRDLEQSGKLQGLDIAMDLL